MATIYEIQVLTIFTMFLNELIFLRHTVLFSKSILQCITKLIFYKPNTIRKTLSQNTELTKTIHLAEKNWFLIDVKLTHQWNFLFIIVFFFFFLLLLLFFFSE